MTADKFEMIKLKWSKCKPTGDAYKCMLLFVEQAFSSKRAAVHRINLISFSSNDHGSLSNLAKPLVVSRGLVCYAHGPIILM